VRPARVDTWRLLVASALIGVLFATMSWLQGRFDTADHEKATSLVREYRAKTEGPTIEAAILARHPEAKDFDLSWSSEIVSSCRGYVRVSGYVSKAKVTYAFDVDLTGPSIHPTDPTTIEVLRALER
jgi:hypothetical protein